MLTQREKRALSCASSMWAIWCARGFIEGHVRWVARCTGEVLWLSASAKCDVSRAHRRVTVTYQVVPHHKKKN